MNKPNPNPTDDPIDNATEMFVGIMANYYHLFEEATNRLVSGEDAGEVMHSLRVAGLKIMGRLLVAKNAQSSAIMKGLVVDEDTIAHAQRPSNN